MKYNRNQQKKRTKTKRQKKNSQVRTYDATHGAANTLHIEFENSPSISLQFCLQTHSTDDNGKNKSLKFNGTKPLEPYSNLWNSFVNSILIALAFFFSSSCYAAKENSQHRSIGEEKKKKSRITSHFVHSHMQTNVINEEKKIREENMIHNWRNLTWLPNRTLLFAFK